ncbi:MAG TPA: hypothetical protein DCE56_14390 [Cyanobacteria bacterium UBA8553]|nr:hypothetical protein [Cyanobacteria bacterium UBA8553]HAJ59117.1 hypothetical protein [Cyanobacteria bacterium UBA8543]
MNTQWKKIWIKATFWLVIEIILNLLGLDNLADYSEFIFEKEIAFATRPPQMTFVVPSCLPQFSYHLPFRYTTSLGA